MSGSSGATLTYANLEPMARGYVDAVVFFRGCSGALTEWKGIKRDDFGPGMLEMATQDCSAFLSAASELHPKVHEGLLKEIESDQLGHTFFLSRQGSGSSFVDQDIAEDLAESLDNLASDVFGYVEVEIGDDRKIYFLTS